MSGKGTKGEGAKDRDSRGAPAGPTGAGRGASAAGSAALRALRESEDRFRSVAESGLIAISFFDTDGAITDANDAFLRLVGYTRSELEAGEVRWDQLTPPEWMPRTREAVDGYQQTGRIEPYEKEYFRKDGERFWGLFGGRRIESTGEGVAFIVDITERKQTEEALRLSEERQAFLLRLSDELRPIADPGEVQATAARVLGEHLGASRVLYLEVTPGGEYAVVKQEYVAGAASVVGTHRVDEYGAGAFDDVRAGRVLAVDDVQSDPRLSAAERQRTIELGALDAYALVPLHKEGRTVAALMAHYAQPHVWDEDEISLIQEVAERTWAAVERARAEDALRQLNKTLETRVQRRTEDVHTLASRVLLAEQRERERIAQLLHDDVQQTLHALNIRMNNVATKHGIDRDDEELAEAFTLLRAAVAGTRSLSATINPPVLQHGGLGEALRWLAQHMSEWHDLHVHVQLDPNELAGLDELRRILVFHSVRELLFNIVKHADVQSARLAARRDGDALVVEVSDDGAGFDAEEVLAREPTGFGLATIRERVRFHGGELTVDSAPGKGTRKTLYIPFGS